MRRLHLDFETRSFSDIRRDGLDRYARSAEVLMLAWAIDDEKPQLWLPPVHASLPGRLFRALGDPSYQKVAWNCAFEREILKHCIGIDVPIKEWLDPAWLARYATMPGSLAGTSEYLGLGDKAKDTEGKRLIQLFCKPHRGRYRTPEEKPEEWEQFKSYCAQDVIAEREALHRLEKLFALPPDELRLAQIDAGINSRGIPVDMQFVLEAQKLVIKEKQQLVEELQALTSLKNPNSGAQMLPWLRERGYPFASLLKKRVDQAVASGVLSPEVLKVLALRAKLSRSSTSKLAALTDRTGPDGFLRHSYTYLGAKRTGRWSGSGVQLQNLPR